MIKWRMEEPCIDCPFNKSGPGAVLARNLEKGRMAGIKEALKGGQAHFMCHKTTNGVGTHEMVCAGSIEWQAARGVTSNLFRCMITLEDFEAQRAAGKK